MNRKLLSAVAASTMLLSLAACSSSPVVETFAAEYEMVGTTSSGAPKNDTFIFEGETTNGKITDLTFEIIRNKGTENEYSKKDIMGYSMNVSDVEITATETGFALTKFSSAGYDDAFTGGQYMVNASIDNLTSTTTFGDLFVASFGSTESLPMEQALAAYSYIANEVGITDFSEATLVVDLIEKHELYAEETFIEGSNRISFAGYHGGRSYGEQIDAIVTHILENEMTLEEVYEMFQTVNQQSTPIVERDTVSGATIAFVGDFQRLVYVAMHGELFEGVVKHTTDDNETVVEVVTQGYAGEIETNVTFDAEGNIVAIAVRDANETDGIGAVLTATDSEFLQSLISNQADIDATDVVSGATKTSNALKEAVVFAQEYFKGL
ncbi:MAG: FMN-binding protein [Erysipelotrichaceae bacterium]